MCQYAKYISKGKSIHNILNKANVLTHRNRMAIELLSYDKKHYYEENV
jgi:hypothetical protein